MAEGGYPGGPSPGPGDEFPRLGAKKPAEPTGPPQHPLSMDYHGTPNAFNDEEFYPEPVPYVLKIRGEYLLWHVGMPRLSTVIATTNSNANLTNGFGAIGDPGTTSLLGPGTYDYHNVSGGRITAGLALGIMPPIELSGFWLSRSLPSLFARVPTAPRRAKFWHDLFRRRTLLASTAWGSKSFSPRVFRACWQAISTLARTSTFGALS